MIGFSTLSSIFDDAIFNLFGSSFDDFLSDSTNIAYRKRTANYKGHTAVSLERTAKNGIPIREYYIDGEKVDEAPAWALDVLTHAVPKLSWPALFEPLGCNNKLPETVVRGTPIPHVNVIHTAVGSLKLEFALAGVSEDRIEITSEDNYLFVRIAPEIEEACPDEEDSTCTDICLQKGIKDFKGELRKQILIDPKKYAIEDLKYKYENGLLTIYVPKTKEPEKNKKVFKKVPERQVVKIPKKDTKVEGN